LSLHNYCSYLFLFVGIIILLLIFNWQLLFGQFSLYKTEFLYNFNFAYLMKLLNF